MREKKNAVKNERAHTGIQQLSPSQTEPDASPMPVTSRKKPPLALTFAKGQLDEKGTQHIEINLCPGQKEFALKQLSEAFGIESLELIKAISNQIFNASDFTQETAVKETQNALTLMYELGPHDPVEGLLMSQMVTCHNTAMDCLLRAYIKGQHFDIKVTYLKSAARFMRLFTEQMGSLNKYRGKGEQKMTVEHVHVNAGGQAVIGNVSSPGGGGKKKDG